MEKKKYVAPVSIVLNLETTPHLLKATKEDFTTAKRSLSRETFDWEDEDEPEDSMWK